VTGRRAAAFLDRDGTIIHDADYLADPDGVRLLPGAGASIARLNANGIPVIVVTNQSGIARGLMTLDDYERVRARLDEVLAAEGARVDATYFCPHHPDYTGPCACRKPGTLLYRRAAEAHDIDLARSGYIGDRWRDVAAAQEFGGRAILVPSSSTPAEDLRRATTDAEIATSLDDAVDRWLRSLLPHPSSVLSSE
jgi:D-glycero-D-manno-heptose 1,7-bisphosphate phosphatase